jgi:hypothetical protein
MSDLSNATQKHTLKSHETIPLTLFRVTVSRSDQFYFDAVYLSILLSKEQN